MKAPRNVVLTGLPRSGTSLTCRLLGQLDDVVALQEPMDVAAFGSMSGWPEIRGSIDAFFAETRRSAVEEGTVISQNLDGKIVDNFYAAPETSGGKVRSRQTVVGAVRLARPVTKDATVIVKHNAAFTALLEELSREYPAFAVIRNPLWALASWNSNALPIHEGHVPMAERLDAGLAAALDAIPDRIDRQIHILSWMFERFARLDAGRILRYEEIVATGGRALKAVVAAAEGLDEPLSSKNGPERYPGVPLDDLSARLLRRGGPFFDFYAKDDARPGR